MNEQIAKVLLEAADTLISAAGTVVEEDSSPLDYRVPNVKRLALIDTTATPPATSDDYFAGGGKKKTKPPTPGTVAFIDYSLYDGGDRVFIHYMSTRSDLRKAGLMKKLLDHLYENFKDKKEINWGRVLSDGAEKLFHKYSEIGQPPTYGKLF